MHHAKHKTTTLVVWFHPWHEWNGEEETPNTKRHSLVSFRARHVLQDEEKTPNTKRHQQGCLFMFGMSGRAKGRRQGDADVPVHRKKGRRHTEEADTSLLHQRKDDTKGRFTPPHCVEKTEEDTTRGVQTSPLHRLSSFQCNGEMQFSSLWQK
jgi:hypothetical protein